MLPPTTSPAWGTWTPRGATSGSIVDLCRAVAAAIFGNGEAVEIVSVGMVGTQLRPPGRRSGSDVHDHDVDHHARLAVGVTSLSLRSTTARDS